MPSYLHVNGFQDSSVASGTTVKYPHISGGGAAAPSAFANSQATSMTDYTWKLLQGRIVTNTSTLTCTLDSFKNGAAGAQTLSWTAAQTGQKQDTTHTDTIASGDLINYRETYVLGSSQQVVFVPVGSVLQTSVGPLVIQTGDGSFALNPSSPYFSLGATKLPTSVEPDVQTLFMVEGYITNFWATLSANTTTVTTTVGLRQKYFGDPTTYDNDTNISWSAATSGRLEDTVNYEYLSVGDYTSFSLRAGGTGGSAVLTQWQYETGVDGLQIGGGTRPTSAPQTVYWPLAGQANNGAALSVESQAQALASIPSLFGNFQVKMSGTTSVSVPTTIEMRSNGRSVGPSIQAGAFSNGFFLDSTTVLNLNGTEQLNLRVVSVGGGGSASFMATVQSPFIPAPGTANPGTATLSLTTFAPTVGRTANVRVTPATATLVTARFAPTVAAPRAVVPGVRALVLARFAPTVAAPRAVVPGTRALVTSRFAPNVALSANIRVTPATAALVLTRFAPTASAPRSVTPGSRALILATFAPSVATPRAVVPATRALLLARFAPTISLSSGSAIGTAFLVLTTFAPRAAAPRSVVPGTKALLTTRFAPAILVTSGAVIGTAFLVITTYPPRIAAPRQVVPGTIALLLLGFAPSASIAHRLMPATLALLLVTFAPVAGVPAEPDNIIALRGGLSLVLLAGLASIPQLRGNTGVVTLAGGG